MKPYLANEVVSEVVAQVLPLILQGAYPGNALASCWRVQRLSGGDCSEVYRLDAPTDCNIDQASLCLKVLRAGAARQLCTEALGLLALRQALAQDFPQDFPQAIPQLYGVWECDGTQVLAMVFCAESPTESSAPSMETLAQLLYRLHFPTAADLTGCKAGTFADSAVCLPLSETERTLYNRRWQELNSGRYLGFVCNNFIGLTPQQNLRAAPEWYIARQWPEFFAELRLLPLMQACARKGRLDTKETRAIENLCRKLPDLLPRLERASLLHGDLWYGNVLWTRGAPVLIDPACYYGHWEVDLAMTQLFAGFDATFYTAYRHLRATPDAPLSDFQRRCEIYNLYHLLNHLLLFGTPYHSRVWRTIRPWAC